MAWITPISLEFIRRGQIVGPGEYYGLREMLSVSDLMSLFDPTHLNDSPSFDYTKSSIEGKSAMRLLHSGTFEFAVFDSENIPPYAIFSYA